MDKYLELISSYIANLYLSREPANLYEPVAYCLANGGKRIRPLMTLLACEMFDGNVREAVPPAVGMELFHNFTLMHDDIMDDAPIRRNKPAVHAKWDNNTAILSGDALFALACQHVSHVPDKALRQVLSVFHQTVIEVCEGQQYDMDFEKRDDVTAGEYLRMIRLKTAVLPAACLQVGAIIAGASARDQEMIYLFGESIGLAFQLRDDWLDVFGDQQTFGKQSGGDIIANKKTWLYIQAMEAGSTAQKRNLGDMYRTATDNQGKKVEEVTGLFRELGVDKSTENQMQIFYDQAFDALHQIRVHPKKKTLLTSLAGSLLSRSH